MTNPVNQFLVSGTGWIEIALTLNRVAVGLFFLLSGYNKLFNRQRHLALTNELKSLHVPAIGFNQWWVPTVEFVGGGAIVLGFLAPLAALGLLVIILVAIVATGPVRVRLYKPIDEADRIDDWLFLPETLYAAMLFVIVCGGSGSFSVDAILGTWLR